jgi:uncharacterized membrane protein
MTDLGALGDNTHSTAAAISPAGQVVGASATEGFGTFTATLWTRK